MKHAPWKHGLPALAVVVATVVAAAAVVVMAAVVAVATAAAAAAVVVVDAKAAAATAAAVGVTVLAVATTKGIEFYLPLEKPLRGFFYACVMRATVWLGLNATSVAVSAEPLAPGPP